MMTVAELRTTAKQDANLDRRLASLRDAEWLQIQALGELPSPASSNSDESLAKSLVKTGICLNFEEPNRPPLSRYELEQEFEGIVLSLNNDRTKFLARIIDLTAGQPDEDAEFDFEDVSPDDHKLIMEGAVFSWTMGRQTCRTQVTRQSEIRFRRVFRFTKSDIARSKKRADELFALLTDEA